MLNRIVAITAIILSLGSLGADTIAKRQSGRIAVFGQPGLCTIAGLCAR